MRAAGAAGVASGKGFPGAAAASVGFASSASISGFRGGGAAVLAGAGAGAVVVVAGCGGAAPSAATSGLGVALALPAPSSFGVSSSWRGVSIVAGRRAYRRGGGGRSVQATAPVYVPSQAFPLVCVRTAQPTALACCRSPD